MVVIGKNHLAYRILAVPITLLFILLVFVLNIPNPMMGLIIPVVLFSYLGGYFPGFISGFITILYSVWFFFFNTQDPVAMQKVLTIVVAVSSIILLMGKLESTVRQNHVLMQQKLNEQAKRLNDSHFALVNALATAVEFRDVESGDHIRRVRDYTAVLLSALADDYQLTPAQVDTISRASVLHDLGKISIPDRILLKPGRLLPEEFEIMKTHTTNGCKMLKALDIAHADGYQYYYDICRYHHERWDGSGYPDKLRGNDIPIWAQVVALVDVYDALTSQRVYKPAYTHEKAISMILNGDCGVFNPQLIDALKVHHLDLLMHQ